MKHVISTFLWMALLFYGCDYLDMVPEKDIETVESVFEQRANADTWLRGIYTQVIGIVSSLSENEAYLGADEFVSGEYMRNFYQGGEYNFPGFKIAEGAQMAHKPYGNICNQGGVFNHYTSFYETIRSCNIFLENINNVYNMEDWEKRQWAAEIKALKAYTYFELVRRYGPIVLVPRNIDVDVDISLMQQPRAHVDTCFNEMVRLLDESIRDLPLAMNRGTERVAFFSKESAWALKARVLLYAASPLFNGNEYYSNFKGKNGETLFSEEYDHEKWKLAAEAADSAIMICEVSHPLYNTTAGRGSELLNTMGDIEGSVLSAFTNSEVLLEWKDASSRNATFHALCLPRVQKTNYLSTAVFGCLAPSMKMVEMYYTEHGLPIDLDNTWDYNGRYQMAMESSPLYKDVVPTGIQILKLHLRREPRFYACIAADRLKWQLGPKSTDNLTIEAYKDEDFGTQYDIITSNDYQNINGYWLKKHLNSRWPLKGYAGNVSDNQTLPVIRMAELYLMQAEAWNEYLEVPNEEKVYAPLNKVRERAGIVDVVTAWKSYSKDPGRVDSKIGMRDIIRREINIELAFEGQRYWNLRRWKIAHEELNCKQMGWNVLGESAQKFYNNFEGPVEVWSGCKFTVPRDYLYPIQSEEVLISSVIQNLGW